MGEWDKRCSQKSVQICTIQIYPVELYSRHSPISQSVWFGTCCGAPGWWSSRIGQMYAMRFCPPQSRRDANNCQPLSRLQSLQYLAMCSQHLGLIRNKGTTNYIFMYAVPQYVCMWTTAQHISLSPRDLGTQEMTIGAEYWRDLAGLIMIVSEGKKHSHKRNCCITNLCSGQNEFQISSGCWELDSLASFPTSWE